MFSITREIHNSFSETASERARNLWDSCSDCLRHFSASLYLDVGTHLGYNASFFGTNAKEIVGLDLKFPKNTILRKSRDAHLIVGDGMHLPLSNGKADMVSLFSVIEHVPNSELLLKEAFRVLKSKGMIIIQIPNRFFPVELHSGLPLFFYIPSRIRNLIIKGIGYEWLGTVDVPSLKKLLGIIFCVDLAAQITVRKVKYSPSIISPRLRATYRLLLRIGLLDLFPLGYLIIIQKK